jgi:predicted transcriptional regulator of viral defense system
MQEIALIKAIGEEGLRVFLTSDVVSLAGKIGIGPENIPKLIHKLIKKGLLRKLFRGTYALPNSLLAGPPLHEYEMIASIARPSALCCWSAMFFHGLTDQILRVIHILVPNGETTKNTSKYEYKIETTRFIVIRVQPHCFFGIEKKFIGESAFFVTDYERTLIDGLVRPQYCGGFFEVLHAYEVGAEKINLEKIVDYAKKYGKGTVKRLGWVFSELGIFKEAQEILKSIPCSSSYLIDVSGANSGEWIKEWNLRKNW